MTTASARAAGGQILVDQLVVHGVEHVFCVPGESYLAVLDALHDAPIDVTVCRQEGGAAMMAEAYGKLTGRPGICFVTRGPGATNASPGLHIARQDSTPMILFVGQIERGMREREAFQELDYRAVFGSIAKWVTEIDDPARIPELISRAFHVATSGRPGPGRHRAAGGHADRRGERSPMRRAYEPVETHPAPAADGATCRSCSGRRERPLAILGGSRWSPQAVQRFSRFAERFALPVVRSLPAPDAHFRPTIPAMPAISASAPTRSSLARIEDADLVLLRRRAPVGDAVARLHAPRHPCAAAAARACPSGPGRARPRLSSAACDQRLADGLLRPPSKASSRPPTSAWRAGTEAAHARLSRLERSRSNPPSRRACRWAT